jgi:hypothetical protein
MTQAEKWLVGFGVVGGVAASVATFVLWMILTRPLALVQAVTP